MFTEGGAEWNSKMKSLVLQHEDSGMITKVDILKAKNLSSLLRMTENFCGE